MRASVIALLAAAGGLVLAGCLGSPAPLPSSPTPQAPPDDGANAAPAPPAPEAPKLPGYLVYPFTGKITAAVGNDQIAYLSPTGSQDPHVFHFNVSSGAIAIVAELAWDNSVNDLDLTVGSPSCDHLTKGTCLTAGGGSPGQGDTPVKLVIKDQGQLNETGDWTLAVWAKDAVNQDFRAAVTVFYLLPPPDNYSALPK
jgi:hypothetical protein